MKRAGLQISKRFLLAFILFITTIFSVGLPSAIAAGGTITSGGCSASVGEVSTATITQVGSDCVIKFTSGNNSWTVPSLVTSVRYLVVAGGGAGGAAGGNDGSGGGGAGGVLAGTFSVGASSYSVAVGAGGASYSSGAYNHNPANYNGANSSISGAALTTITSIGGGSGSSESTVSRAAQTGGSGGGGGGYSGAKGSGTPGPPRQGYDGGATSGPGDGGGGGAGAPGGNGNSTNGGTAIRAGGIGVINNITGVDTYYGGGGGASGDTRNTTTSGGAGGLGGGGAGANATSGSAPSNGAANTGGGGGGAAGNTPVGSVKATGAGGSGVVIIRYLGDATAPAFTNGTSFSLAENSATSTNAATITANESVTITINAGIDSALFTVIFSDSTTARIRFSSSPNFEGPVDFGANNIYNISVKATDSAGNTADQSIAIAVDNVNEAPAISINSSAPTHSLSQSENSTSVTTYAATDVDIGASLFWSISGTDAADLSIVSNTGVLVFNTATDFEAPADSDGNNSYVIVVSVSDGALTDTQTLTITITNSNESSSLGTPSISGSIYKGSTSSITVNSKAAGIVRFYIGGKRIPNCLAVTTTGSGSSYTATCSWKPAVQNRQFITASITPTLNTFTASTSPRLEIYILKRSGNRS